MLALSGLSKSLQSYLGMTLHLQRLDKCTLAGECVRKKNASENNTFNDVITINDLSNLDLSEEFIAEYMEIYWFLSKNSKLNVIT